MFNFGTCSNKALHYLYEELKKSLLQQITQNSQRNNLSHTEWLHTFQMFACTFLNTAMTRSRPGSCQLHSWTSTPTALRRVKWYALGHTGGDNTRSTARSLLILHCHISKPFLYWKTFHAFHAKWILKMINTVANITWLIHTIMALCNDTKSPFAYKDKISPFLLLDMANGENQIVLLRSHALLHVNFTPLSYSGNLHWPFPALSCSRKLEPFPPCSPQWLPPLR